MTLKLPFPASVKAVILLDDEVWEITPEKELSKTDLEKLRKIPGSFAWSKKWFVNKAYYESKVVK